jgi:hypothetical protein
VHEDVEQQVAPGGDEGLAPAVGVLLQLGDQLAGSGGGGVAAGHVAVDGIEVAAGPHGGDQHADHRRVQGRHGQVGGDVTHAPLGAQGRVLPLVVVEIGQQAGQGPTVVGDRPPARFAVHRAPPTGQRD